ncbi:hypothetical protein NPIL_488281 [Nephila pilipes]|uniref:Uncharacterized protein n=1 Tax=Nephila pilipes TaxID=299642 RepID=A0A8X6TU04_NEPPI|nr:hypothetical protein NPIL_488281 [Nephila pilipes]
MVISVDSCFIAFVGKRLLQPYHFCPYHGLYDDLCLGGQNKIGPENSFNPGTELTSVKRQENYLLLKMRETVTGDVDATTGCCHMYARAHLTMLSPEFFAVSLPLCV